MHINSTFEGGKPGNSSCVLVAHAPQLNADRLTGNRPDSSICKADGAWAYSRKLLETQAARTGTKRPDESA
jgi:hypothetical protein